MRSGRREWLCGLAVAVAFLAAPSGVPAQPLPVGGFRVFARVPEPGQPEGLAVAPDGTVYAGTDVAPFGVRPEGIQPSKIFAFSPSGVLKRSYTIAGESYAPWYGLFGLAVDGDGIVYALDHNPARVLAIDPVTGGQTTYASFSQVPPCRVAPPGAQCKDTMGDSGSFPNFIVFAQDGTMYVSDTSQALIWRIPRGGGSPQVWYTDAGLESVFGPNDLALSPDGRTLLIGFSTPSYNGQLSPGLYALPILADGRPGRLRQVWHAQSSDFPEGGKVAQSGRLYLSLGGANQVLVTMPDGRELARYPSTSSENASMEIPLDDPATIVFAGTDALIANHAYTGYNPQHWAILAFHAGERGAPLFYPIVRPFATAPAPVAAPGAGPGAGGSTHVPAVRITLRVRPAHVRAGRRRRFRFRATFVAGGRRLPVRGGLLSFAGRHRRTNARGRATITARLHRPGLHRARAREPGLLDGLVAVRTGRRRR